MAKESAPYGIAAAALLVVGASAAISAVLVLGSNAEPPVAVAGAVDASAALPPRPASARTPTTDREDSGTPAPAPSSSGKPAASASASASPTEATGPGFLTIITTPAAKLSVHGRVLCTTTPCSKLPLPAGSHTLTLENKEDASKTIVAVTITSGETTVKRVKLKTAPTAP